MKIDKYPWKTLPMLPEQYGLVLFKHFCKHDSFASNTVTNVTKYDICTYIIIYEEIQRSHIYIVIIFNYIPYIPFYISKKCNIHGVLMIMLKNKNVISSLW